MRPSPDDRRKQIARLLRRQPGWRLQAMSTPGSPVVWCFGSGNSQDISVTVESASISVSTAAEGEIDLDSTDELVAWLTAHRPRALSGSRGGLVEKLKDGTLFKWG